MMTQSPIARVLILGASLVVVVAGLRAAAAFIAPALLAMLLAVAVLPMIHWLERKRLPTWVSILLVIVGGLLIGSALIFFVSMSLVRLGIHLPAYQESFTAKLTALANWLARYGVPMPSASSSEFFSVSRIFSVLGTVFGILSRGLTAALLSLLLFVVFSIEAARVTRRIGTQLGVESPAAARFVRLGKDIASYFRVRAYNNLFVGAALTGLFWGFGVDFAGLWGVLAFFLGFIPNIGLPLAVAPAVVLAWIQHGGLTALLIIGGAILINILGDYVLTPRMAGKALNMSIATIFLSFIFWAWIFGPLGALISIPLTSIVMMALDSYRETRWMANLMSAQGLKEYPDTESTVSTAPPPATGGPDEQHEQHNA
jgi:predicted PurR-regulated permease PerM